MPTAYVTGATGFVGLNLVKRLTQEGWEVRALHRSSSDLAYLSRFDADRVVGDVTDRASLERSMPENLDVVFHVAASVNFWSRNNDAQTKTNVEGTRNVVDVALEKRAARFVQTSSFVAFGPTDGDVLNEECESKADGHWVNYFRTKYLSDNEVLAGIDRGLHASFVHPGYVLGPYELANFSEMFRLLKEGKLPGTFSGSGPWCHVDGVVHALIRAAEIAEPGERYLIGAVHATVAEVAEKIARRVGVDPPRPLPAWLMKSIARIMDWGSLITGREPDITPEVVHMFSMNTSFDSTKAERELGYRETTLDHMVDDTYAWLQAEGRI
jgi:nucleoside-diphosphate-sugar epimerase